MFPRSALIEAIQNRLKQITIANGFYTNAGQRIERQRHMDSEPDSFPCLNLVTNDTEYIPAPNAPPAMQAYIAKLAFDVEYMTRNREFDPMPHLDQAVEDIKRALLTEPLPCKRIRVVSSATDDREHGGQFVAAIVSFEIEFTEKYC